MITYEVCVHTNDSICWYLDGRLHCEHGPAVVYANGNKSWWLDNEKLTEEEFNRRTTKAKELTVKEISTLLGYEVKIVK